MPVRPRLRPAVLWSGLVLAVLLLAAPALGQSTNGTATPTSVSLSLTTSSTTVTTTIHSNNRDITTTTVVPTVFNVTITPTSSASRTSSAAASATSTAPPDYTKLDTHIDGAFGALGAVLILTGLPSAFLGHKNRWTSFFLIGFYTLSLVCFVLILRFGVIQAINPPNKTLRGLFVLSSGVAGIAGGGIAIFFWKAAKYFIGAWGGFALALWIQCFRDGGLIGPLGFRWIMYIGATLSFLSALLTGRLTDRVLAVRVHSHRRRWLRVVHHSEASLLHHAHVHGVCGSDGVHAWGRLLHDRRS